MIDNFIEKIIEKTKQQIDEYHEPVKRCIVRLLRDELANNLATQLREMQFTIPELVEYIYLTMKARGLLS